MHRLIGHCNLSTVTDLMISNGKNPFRCLCFGIKNCIRVSDICQTYKKNCEMTEYGTELSSLMINCGNSFIKSEVCHRIIFTHTLHLSLCGSFVFGQLAKFKKYKSWNLKVRLYIVIVLSFPLIGC